MSHHVFSVYELVILAMARADELSADFISMGRNGDGLRVEIYRGKKIVAMYCLPWGAIL